MAWLLPIVTKLAWWLLPKVAAGAVDYVKCALEAVEHAAVAISDSGARRLAVMQELGGMLPEPITRLIIEFCVILNSIGVRSSQLAKMEELVAAVDGFSFTSGEKRTQVLLTFMGLFPDVPERIARLLLELAVAKVKSMVGSGSMLASLPIPPDGTSGT